MSEAGGYQKALNLTISLCLIYTVCIALVRIVIRKGSFGSDDFVIAAATVLTLCNAAASYVALSKGLGLPWRTILNEGTISSLSEASIAGLVTFMMALYVSKCAMLFFLSRITKTPQQIRLFFICNIFTAVIGVISVLTAVAGCPTASGYYWAFHANRHSCPSQNIRWQTITGLDIITEVLLLALPVYLVWGLQMSMRKKAIILIAFYLRLPVLGFSIGRNYYTMQLRLPQTDPGLTSAVVVVWLEVELAYALAASTLAALKAFTESFQTCFGLGFTRGKGDGSYGMSDVSGASSKSEKSKDPASLESAASRSRNDSVSPYLSKEEAEVQLSPATPPPRLVEDCSLKLRPERELRTLTQVSAEPMSSDQNRLRQESRAESEMSGSDDMVILRETGYEVQHDRAPMLYLNRL
ncbi:hypothetical protein BAUCODRAFT_150636 [Baudoinia panamericana UAMH 10762]|uniref:Rhodopsin domain-containing protein n=1 Tax=Baudoinia panamericana (strain UAMH 10762) TaxID=717646 RepID=M2N2T1_BAUPA|nr:uncharacterized protein BAUCODRAFT_150636 [Baudoinia panamericana UAMH 10762]EMC93284.1 hypothetical protein BAUCODRAFT_150636 [Baudoinia panamericana UAMH 10762]